MCRKNLFNRFQLQLNLNNLWWTFNTVALN